MERMNSSAIRTGLPTFIGDELIKCCSRLISIDQEWVPHSTASSLYIRPTLIGIDVSIYFLMKRSVMTVESWNKLISCVVIFYRCLFSKLKSIV